MSTAGSIIPSINRRSSFFSCRSIHSLQLLATWHSVISLHNCVSPSSESIQTSFPHTLICLFFMFASVDFVTAYYLSHAKNFWLTLTFCHVVCISWFTRQRKKVVHFLNLFRRRTKTMSADLQLVNEEWLQSCFWWRSRVGRNELTQLGRQSAQTGKAFLLWLHLLFLCDFY